MQNILFATDFSENSAIAYDYALDIAYLGKTSLTLLATYKLPYSKSNLLVSMQDRMKEDTEKELDKLRQKALNHEKYKDLDIRLEVRSGSFVSTIQIVANQINAGLIVIGSSGAAGIVEMVTGGNAIEVVHSSNCPVLAVPEKADNSKIDKIAMAVDLKKIKSPERLQPLLDMARICRASIEFVHVMHPDHSESAAERFKEIMFLENFASKINSNINIITDKDIIEGLSRYMQDEKPGMLAMLTRKHSLFERLFTQSITNKLSFRSNIPMLILDE